MQFRRPFTPIFGSIKREAVMTNLWVYKLDSSVQCGGHEPTSPNDDALQLETLIGNKIIDKIKTKSHDEYIQVCGAPTGNVNAFLISYESAYLLFNGNIGPLGFAVWPWEPPQNRIDGQDVASPTNQLFDRPVPWPWDGKFEPQNAAFANFIASVTQVGIQPVSISELRGRRFRVYKAGDVLTLDYIQSRVNIETSADSVIQKIWFG